MKALAIVRFSPKETTINGKLFTFRNGKLIRGLTCDANYVGEIKYRVARGWTPSDALTEQLSRLLCDSDLAYIESLLMEQN